MPDDIDPPDQSGKPEPSEANADGDPPDQAETPRPPEPNDGGAVDEREHISPYEIIQSGDAVREDEIRPGANPLDVDSLAEILTGVSEEDARDIAEQLRLADDERAARAARADDSTADEDEIRQIEQDYIERGIRERERQNRSGDPAESAPQAEPKAPSTTDPKPKTRNPLLTIPFTMILGGIFLAASVVGVTLWLSRDSGGDTAEVEVDGDIDPAGEQLPESAGSVDGQTSGSAEAPIDEAPIAPTVCETAATQPSTLSFSSPDIGPGIPVAYYRYSGYDLGFPTPAFDWSGVPPAATELMITVQRLNDDEGEAISSGATDLLEDGWPFGDVTWSATIATDFTSLPRTWFTAGNERDDAKVESYGDAIDNYSDAVNAFPAGVVANPHDGGVPLINGEQIRNAFMGIGTPYSWYLFTLFALCDPPEQDPTDDSLRTARFRPDGARPYAIDEAWFLARADF